jgi:hypothetical protein
MTQPANDIELGTIGTEKTNTHSVKVAIREWNGDLGVDIRRWYKFGNDWRATTKGIRLRAKEVSEAITFLEHAEKELKDRGIL